MTEYSVVVPVYNSKDSLEELFQRTHKVFSDLNKEYEIIFVEDGGWDESWEVIKKIKAQNPENVKGIKLSRNFGQHNAVMCGFAHVQGKYVITIDDDLQLLPEDIKKLIDCYNEQKPDLVYGYFKKKNHSAVRNFGSNVIKKSSKVIYKTPGEGSSFRLIKREIVDSLLQHSQEFVYIDDLLLWYTTSISFVEVEHKKRQYNTTQYSTFNLFKLAFRLLIASTDIPLKVMVYGGFLSSILTFLFGLYYIFRKIFYKVPPGYTSIIVTILFSTSIIILSLGIIGQYLHKVYKMQNKRPAYLVKEKI